MMNYGDFVSEESVNFLSKELRVLLVEVDDSTRQTVYVLLRKCTIPKYEGAVKEGGRHLSIWDTFTHNYPDGKLSGGVNKEGIRYYNNLINELLANGIQPFVTLFHWDLPQVLEDEYGGFLSHRIVDDFRDYVEVCFKEFGDRVKHWITLNEPWSYSYSGYSTGFFAPDRCSDWLNQNCTDGDFRVEPYLVAHHQLLAHAASV